MCERNALINMHPTLPSAPPLAPTRPGVASSQRLRLGVGSEPLPSAGVASQRLGPPASHAGVAPPAPPRPGVASQRELSIAPPGVASQREPVFGVGSTASHSDALARFLRRPAAAAAARRVYLLTYSYLHREMIGFGGGINAVIN